MFINWTPVDDGKVMTYFYPSANEQKNSRFFLRPHSAPEI